VGYEILQTPQKKTHLQKQDPSFGKLEQSSSCVNCQVSVQSWVGMHSFAVEQGPANVQRCTGL
jgi:hypothetical protein